MTAPRTGPNNRWQDAVSQAIIDLTAQEGVDGRTLYAVWSFEGVNVTQHSGFNDFLPTLTSLNDLLFNWSPAGSTPLVDAMCDTIDELVAAHGPGPNLRCRVLAVYSDGGDNSSFGTCIGPASTGGTSCGTFDPGSWQQNICDKLTGNVTGLFRYWNHFQFLAPPSISTTLCAWSQATNGAYTFIEDSDPNYPGVVVGDCVTDWIFSGGASGTCDCPTLGDNSGDLGCDGSAGGCPCGQGGAPGHGCMNTNPNLLGAKLVGTGHAAISPDSLVLTVTDGPANTPGLFIQGSNAISNPVGDGLLCTAPQIRYNVQFLDSNGSTSRTGFGVNANVNDTRHYQFWYRDAGNPCNGSFNFTNSWVVTWQ